MQLLKPQQKRMVLGEKTPPGARLPSSYLTVQSRARKHRWLVKNPENRLNEDDPCICSNTSSFLRDRKWRAVVV